MKTPKTIIKILMVILFLGQQWLLAQTKEIPITTSSKEALKIFLEARERSENFETAEAALLYDKAIALDPEFAIAYLNRAGSGGGYTLWKTNYDKAVSLIDKVTEGEKLLILYSQSVIKGQGQQRKEYLDQLLEKYPKDKRVHLLAAGYFYDLSEYQKAIVHYKKATSLDKNFAPAFNMLGYSYSALNNYKEAEKAFQNYIKLIPNRAASYDSYAELLLKMGKHDESMVQYKKALKIDPSFSYSLLGMANNLVFKEKYSEARNYYQQYYDRSKSIIGKFSALFWMATSYVHEGNVDGALKTLEERRMLAILEKNIPYEINSVATQAFILAETGDVPRAVELFKTAISMAENADIHPDIKENLKLSAKTWKIYSLAINNQLDEARTEIENCRQQILERQNPGEIKVMNCICGNFERICGNFDKSINYFAEANSESPYDWFCLARAYHGKGDKSKADEILKKIADLKQNSLELALVRNRALED